MAGSRRAARGRHLAAQRHARQWTLRNARCRHGFLPDAVEASNQIAAGPTACPDGARRRCVLGDRTGAQILHHMTPCLARVGYARRRLHWNVVISLYVRP